MMSYIKDKIRDRGGKAFLGPVFLLLVQTLGSGPSGAFGGEVNWLGSYNPIQLPVSILNGRLVSFQDKLWCIDGKLKDDPAEIFVSDNGIEWKALGALKTFSGRARETVTVFKDKLWVIGGTKSVPGKKWYGQETGEIWTSADGIHWELSLDSPWPKGIENHSCVVFRNRLFVIGGSQNSSWPGKEWITSDGATWVGKDPVGLKLGDEQLCFVWGNKIWYLGGEKRQESWFSGDGENWTRLAGNLPFTVGAASQAWVTPDGVYLGGTGVRESDSITSSSNNIWFSPDAKHWKVVAWNVPLSTGFGFSGAFFHGAMWAVATGGEVYFSSADSLDAEAQAALKRHNPKK